MSDDHASEGSSYFGTVREADAYVAELKAAGYSDAQIEIDTTKTPRTKAAMLRLLAVWASHPDNG